MRKLLDLFCGAGGCTKGYQQAGFWVRGVDVKRQHRYVGEEFIQADALAYLQGLIESGEIAEFDAIHASPPCQAYSQITKRNVRAAWKERHDLIDDTRKLLRSAALPYVIENVVPAPLQNAILLCGSMFGLDVRRHRIFESSHILFRLPCRHELQIPRFRSLDGRRKGLSPVVGVHGHLNYTGEFELRCKAMGINWMLNDELTQAIPPAYTEFIGRQLFQAIHQPAGA